MITVAYIFYWKAPQTHHSYNIYKLAVGSKSEIDLDLDWVTPTELEVNDSVITPTKTNDLRCKLTELELWFVLQPRSICTAYSEIRPPHFRPFRSNQVRGLLIPHSLTKCILWPTCKSTVLRRAQIGRTECSVVQTTWTFGKVCSAGGSDYITFRQSVFCCSDYMNVSAKCVLWFRLYKLFSEVCSVVQTT